MSVSYPGMVRAWHKHERGQVDHFLAVRGAMKICAYDDETRELDEIISAGDNPSGGPGAGTLLAWISSDRK